MLVLVIISISLTVGIYGQGAPPLAVTSSPNTFDPNCVDVLNNCWDMPESNCQAPYEQWAKDNCPNRCKYCNGPTTPKPECRNKLTDCETYDKSVCTNPDYTKWVAENCRYYCRMCTQDELIRMDAMTTTTTTIPPSLCKDKVDCRAYGANACSDSFKAWSKDNCKNYCGYCRGPPTPPPACVDHIPTCSAYDAKTCTDPNYDLWVEDNCKKFCGRCGGSGGSSPGGGVPTPGNSGVPVPMTGRDLPVITYAPPTPPKPGRRNVKTALFKRQFHASHHHAGETAGCFDSNSSECKSDGNDLTSGFPGSEYKPRPTPDSNWDSKPSTEAPVTTKSTKATTIKDDKPSTTGTTTTTISMPITSQTTEVLTTPSIDSTDGGSSATPEQSSPIAVTNTTTQPGTFAPSANTTTATIGSTMAAISSEAPTTQSQTGLTDTGTSSTIVTDQSTTDSPSTSTTTAPIAVTEVLTTTTTASQTSAPVVTSTIPAAVSSTEASTPSSTSPSTASTTTVVTTPEPTTTTTPTLPSTSAPTTSTAPTSTLPSTAAPTTQSSTPASTLPSTPAPTTQPSTPAPTTSTTPTSTLPPTAAPTTQSSPPTTTSSPTSTTVASTAAPTTKPPVARQSTTLAVETSTIECKDTVDNCVGYGLRICNDTLYLPWAKAHCPAFCEFCVPPTLTPFKCENKIGNCRQFDSGDLCTNTEYFAWSRENCFAYCGYHPCGTTTQPSGPQSP